ncbi:ArsR/SmtB family transcription factor [Streptomyces sp. NPDC102462]|uniref:ArsR/SmtB family transcription factor n=1 Tax=Streptomyces sp. NPDC102462 TaxID=3366178 RepID=UPI00381928DC
MTPAVPGPRPIRVCRRPPPLRARTAGSLPFEGRGLLLLPSFFCWGAPITLRDAGPSPVIVYPIAHDLGWSRADARPDREALRALLGRTRADLLAAIADGGGSTTELARRLVVSPAAVSQHATALRDAGLIVTRRRGQGVHHCATPLGNALLNGNRRIPPAHVVRSAPGPRAARLPS